ncbi:MAG: LacI family DNA-binding transcriptional regulator [Bacteroidales bacterium]|nr:LacI family DNA-binding transcriptional regulator [Bacteroidales bacterium]
MKKGDKTKSVGVLDIAEKLNISPSTVSRALNDHPKISKQTKEKVLDAALKMGYNPTIPNLMVPEKSDIVALIVPDVEKAFYRKIIEGIREELESNGLSLMVFISQKNEITVEKLYDNFLKMNIRGIIYVSYSKNVSLPHLNRLSKNNIPCVIINYTQEDFPYTYVIPDIFQGAYDLTTHLVESGCRSLALFAGSPNDLIDNTVLDGFQNALVGQDNDTVKKNVFFIPGNDRPGIFNQLKALLDGNSLPEGIVATSPEIAFIILNFLTENNVRVPEDVFLAVIGEEQDPFFFKPSLSRLVLPGKILGQMAVQELMKQLTDINYEKHTIVHPVKFIIKNSTLRP